MVKRNTVGIEVQARQNGFYQFVMTQMIAVSLKSGYDLLLAVFLKSLSLSLI